MLTLDMVREAQEALRGIARRTPLDRAPKFGENVYIKAENLQLTGAFKLRGAYNKIRSLTPEEAARGVIACSAGNHAQGIALSASRLGIKAVICMPAGAPISKVEATRGYGAEVVLVPGVYDDAAAEAERLTKEQGYTFAHPFNDPLVIAGQGTIGLELLEQLLAARGLKLNWDKTYISKVSLGFEFLSRWYPREDSVLVARPSDQAVKRFENSLESFILGHKGSQQALIERLNRKLNGWGSYHRVTDAYDAFRRIDSSVQALLIKKMRQLHPKRKWKTIQDMYWYEQEAPYLRPAVQQNCAGGPPCRTGDHGA